MSGRYVSLVLESALAPDLKFTAAVLASFADEDGYRVWPAVPHVAYLRGVSERAVQFHIKDLRTMDILELVKPATQWHPAHYRIVAEKLPARAPYQAADRQPWLLGPPGVNSTSPLPGVKPSAPGVKPASPDPSLDPPLRTHMTRAREADDGRLPLVVGPLRDTDHQAHAWCGRICMPRFLHRQLRSALGGPVAKRGSRLRAFYAETLAAIPAVTPIGDAPVPFWRAAFAARFGEKLPRRPLDLERTADRERTTDYIARMLAEERDRKSG
jgi:hypothetical protein